MSNYAELNAQNHRITELTNVLRVLLNDRAMCDNHTCCELFNRYMDLVHEHIDVVDTEMYGELLKSSDEKMNNVAKNFMSGSQEVKRIVNKFNKKWCPAKGHKDLKIRDYDEFHAEVEQLFDIVLERILNETEKLYPLVRSFGIAA